MTSNAAFTIQELMDAGVHFGHRTMRWNPKMQPFIYGSKNGVHILDLQKTAPLLHRALGVAQDVASKNGRILFVATKRQGSKIVAEAAERCGQYFVNHRWMGGTLTNWQTVSQSIKTLDTYEQKLADTEINLPKKERLQIQREVNKLNLALGGIKKMGGVPDLVIVIDTNRERNALKEARKLGVPVIAVVDTNCNPDDIEYIVPGNDDSIKSIRLFCNLFAEAILTGIQKSVGGFSNKKPASSPANDDEAKEKPDASSNKKSGKKDEKSKPEKKATEVVKKTSKVKAKKQDDESADKPE
ncbi:MAG: 30S ribosomal protein S2 [Rickettsiales bacterium]|nr:30S ribosomal protein S2 [Rickettsiales bacterium]